MQVVTNNFVNNYCHKLEVFDDRKVVDKNLLTLYKARCVCHKTIKNRLYNLSDRRQIKASHEGSIQLPQAIISTISAVLKRLSSLNIRKYIVHIIL